MPCRSIQIGECIQVQSPIPKIEIANQNRGGELFQIKGGSELKRKAVGEVATMGWQAIMPRKEISRITRTCWNVPMVSVGPGTITTSNGGRGQKQRIWVRQKERTKHDSFYFQVYAIYIESQNCLLLSICQLVLVITLPNCARVLGGFVSGLSKSVSPSKYIYFVFWVKRDIDSPKLRTGTIIVLVPIMWVLSR